MRVSLLPTITVVATQVLEVFAETGLELKATTPFAKSFTIEIANGYYGYLPTPPQHKLGGYETWLGTNRLEVVGDRGGGADARPDAHRRAAVRRGPQPGGRQLLVSRRRQRRPEGRSARPDHPVYDWSEPALDVHGRGVRAALQ